MSRKSEQRKKRIISVILVGCLAVGGTFTYFKQAQVKRQAEIVSRNKSIFSTQVKRSTIKSTIVGTGSLETGDAKNIQVPSGIIVDEVLIESGDTVEEGQVLATLNKKSLDDAIRKVESNLESIDDELSDMDNQSDERIITAPVSGRVMAIYAYGADKVRDVISDHGSLMIISTDGKLAVDIPNNGNLTVGSQLLVELPDGNRIYGTLDSLQGQTATITIPDNKARVSSNVSILEGNTDSVLAEGKLYVHSPINITASSGTVNKVYISENSYVEQGDYLIRLTAANDDINRQQLLSDREELVQTLNKLKEYSLSGSITAPYSGTIKDVNLYDHTTITKPVSTSGASSLSSLSSLAGSDSLASFSSMMSLGYCGQEEDKVITLPSHTSIPRAISLSYEEEWYLAEAAEEEDLFPETDSLDQEASAQALEENLEGFSDPQAAWEEALLEEIQNQEIYAQENQESSQSITYLQGSIYLPLPVPKEGDYPSSAPMVSPLLQAHLSQEGREGVYCITGMEWVNPGPFALGERCIALVTLETDTEHGIVFTPSTDAFTIEAEGNPDCLFLLEDGNADGYYERMVVGLAYTALPSGLEEEFQESFLEGSPDAFSSEAALDSPSQEDSFSSLEEDPFLYDSTAEAALEEKDTASLEGDQVLTDTPFEDSLEIAGQALEERDPLSPFGEDASQAGDDPFDSFTDEATAAMDLSLFGDTTDPYQVLLMLSKADDATLQGLLDMVNAMSDEQLDSLISKISETNPQMAQYAPLVKQMLKSGTLTPTILRTTITSILKKLPTPTVTPAPSPTPTTAPTQTPQASVTPSITPSGTPSVAPTGTPSVAPTGTPTGAPSITPSVAPTGTPTAAPTKAPTAAPTTEPTKAPTQTPTPKPSSPSQEAYLQLLKALLGGGDVDYSALLKALMSGSGSEGSSLLSAILSSLFQGSGNNNGLLSLLSSLFNSGSEFTSGDTSSFSLSSFLKSLLGSGNTSALSGLSSLLGGSSSGLSSLLGGSTSGLSSLLGSSGTSGLSSLLGSSGASGLSSLLGSSGASGLNSSALSSLLGGSASSYSSLLDSLSGENGLSSLTSALSSSSLGSLSSLGSTASTYQDVPGFSIADSQLMSLVININELDVLSVAVGQLVELTLDSLPGETFPGIVTKIAKNGTNSGGFSKYPVTISLLKDDRMLIGMNASATITTQENPNVLVIPSDSIHESFGKTYVYTSKTEEGILEGETQVLTGISDGDYVEVTQGLNEGQNIYYNFSLGSGDIPYEQMMNQMQDEMNSMQEKGES